MLSTFCILYSSLILALYFFNSYFYIHQFIVEADCDIDTVFFNGFIKENIDYKNINFKQIISEYHLSRATFFKTISQFLLPATTITGIIFLIASFKSESHPFLCSIVSIFSIITIFIAHFFQKEKYITQLNKAKETGDFKYQDIFLTFIRKQDFPESDLPIFLRFFSPILIQGLYFYLYQ